MHQPQGWWNYAAAFRNRKDVAFVCGPIRKAKLSSKFIKGNFRIAEDDDEGGSIQLFDDQHGLFGPVAVPIEPYRGIHQNSPHSGQNVFFSDPRARSSLLVAYLRKRRFISNRERSRGNVMEEHVHRDFPPPAALRAGWDSTWTYQRLQAEATARGITDVTGWTPLRRAIRERDWEIKQRLSHYERDLEGHLLKASYTCKIDFRRELFHRPFSG